MTDKQPGVVDVEVEITETISAIKAAYSGWTEAEARTNEACYAVLAEIYVRAPSIDADIAKKTALVREVRKHPDVGLSNRYDPFKSNAADLMLTLLFGLRQQRNTKSHWRSVLQAAERECEEGRLGRSRDDFICWIRETTIHGARKIVAKPRAQFDPATLEQFIHEDVVELPFALPSDLNAPSGFALLIVKLGEATDARKPTAAYVGCVANPRLLEAARKLLESQHAKERREIEDQLLLESGDPALLIPKAARAEFGRTHFTDEDERDDYLAEKKYLAQESRRRSRGKPKTQWELAMRTKGQAALPVPDEADNIEARAQGESSDQLPETGADDDNIHYFAALTEDNE